MLWSKNSNSSCIYHVVLSCTELMNLILPCLLSGSKHWLEVNLAPQMFSFSRGHTDRNGTLIIWNAFSRIQIGVVSLWNFVQKYKRFLLYCAIYEKRVVSTTLSKPLHTSVILVCSAYGYICTLHYRRKKNTSQN